MNTAPDRDPNRRDPSRRYMNLNVYLRNSGYHEAAWRVSPADPARWPPRPSMSA